MKKQKSYSVLRDVTRRSRVIGNLAKETAYNPGRVARKVTAGFVKDPVTGAAMAASQLAPIPGAGTVTMAAAPAVQGASKNILGRKTMGKLRKASRSIMSRSSSLGNKIEYHGNRLALGASELAQRIAL